MSPYEVGQDVQELTFVVREQVVPPQGAQRVGEEFPVREEVCQGKLRAQEVQLQGGGGVRPREF